MTEVPFPKPEREELEQWLRNPCTQWLCHVLRRSVDVETNLIATRDGPELHRAQGRFRAWNTLLEEMTRGSDS